MLLLYFRAAGRGIKGNTEHLIAAFKPQLLTSRNAPFHWQEIRGQVRLMLTRQININNLKRPTKEHYLFAVRCANHIVHGLVAAHIHSETHDTPMDILWAHGYSVELRLLTTALETALPQ